MKREDAGLVIDQWRLLLRGGGGGGAARLIKVAKGFGSQRPGW
jgi:hypothetical protein